MVYIIIYIYYNYIYYISFPTYILYIIMYYYGNNNKGIMSAIIFIDGHYIIMPINVTAIIIV